MKNKLIFLLLFIFTTLYGCNKSEKLEQELSEFMQHKVNLSVLDTPILGLQDSMFAISDKDYAKMIIYFDSLQCSSCHLSTISLWEHIVEYSKSTDGGFLPIFIFSPEAHKINQVKKNIKARRLKFSVFIDYNAKFRSANSFIPTDDRFHVFLLDKSNNIVLVGDPLYNDKLWELYRSTIDELIKNKGILPEE